MKEIVVISGKGGTGKTSITASFSMLAGTGIVTADCDVDAADLHLLLKPDFNIENDFYGGFVALVDKSLCIGCGLCAEVCQFDALIERDSTYSVKPIQCEGCGYCTEVCPTGAIQMHERFTGNWYDSTIKTQGRMIHAKLGIGADNSGKLVAKVKKEARSIAERLGIEIILIDGAPGIGCPVISSLSGAALTVLVTEATIAGFHDLKRVYELVKKFKIPAACIINKVDLNREIAEDIRDFLKSESIPVLVEIPYDEIFYQAMTAGKTIIEFGHNAIAEKIQKAWNETLSLIG
jgi:MinD superfamily P-loop ATPase